MRRVIRTRTPTQPLSRQKAQRAVSRLALGAGGRRDRGQTVERLVGERADVA